MPLLPVDDHTRVILSQDNDQSDYINANYIMVSAVFLVIMLCYYLHYYYYCYYNYVIIVSPSFRQPALSLDLCYLLGQISPASSG